jgi:hypothetical protein
VYSQNWSPHHILQGKTPEEAFIGNRLEIGRLGIFGCPVYIHILVENSTKLQPSGERGILVGYSEDSKAYKVFLLNQRKTVVRQDVKFEKNMASRKSRDLLGVVEGPQEVGPKDDLREKAFNAGSQTPVEMEEQLALRLQSGGPCGLSRPCGMLESMLSLPGPHSRRADLCGNFRSIWL